MKTGIIYLKDYKDNDIWFDSLYVINESPIKIGKEIIDNPEKYFNLNKHSEIFSYKLVGCDDNENPNIEKFIRDVSMELEDRRDIITVFFAINKENDDISKWKICKCTQTFNIESNKIPKKGGYIENELNDETLYMIA